MNVAARLGAFAAVLTLTFGSGLALGAAFGPDTPAPAAVHQDGHAEPPVPTTAAPVRHTTDQPATPGSQP